MRIKVWVQVSKQIAVVVVLLSFVFHFDNCLASTPAAPLTLAWNPSSDPTVKGYAIYYGPASQPPTMRADAGSDLRLTFYDLQADLAYRFLAVSYDSQGVESAPSNELLVTLSAMPRLQLGRQADGSMRLSGKAAAGAVCSLQFTPTLNPPKWQTLQHVTADQSGNVIAQDPSARQVASRFYRLVPGSQPLLGGMEIQLLRGGFVLLKGIAPPGATGRIVYASNPNPSTWQTMAAFTADAEGRVIALDTKASQATTRFYSMVMP